MSSPALSKKYLFGERTRARAPHDSDAYALPAHKWRKHDMIYHVNYKSAWEARWVKLVRKHVEEQPV